METSATIEPGATPVPGVSSTTRPAPLPGRRNRASRALGKLVGVIRGDKYMADAYPPVWRGSAAARDGHDGAAGARAAVASQSHTAERAARAAARTKER
jgi:hypothetical protein